MAILTINSGSTSLKFGLYRDDGTQALASGEVEGIGVPRAGKFQADAETKSVGVPTQKAAFGILVDWMREKNLEKVLSVGHRIVHGGPELTTHQRLTHSVLKTLEGAIHFAPLHIPPALELVRAAKEQFPEAPQFACFDTAFHQTMPALAYTYPLPLKYRQAGLRRYGFHGLSYESVVHALAGAVPACIVAAHLGGGSSVCALADGRSVDTSMGVSPAGGVIMGTRSGDVDPGLVLLLQRRLSDTLPALSVDETESLLNHESGLKALAETGDMQTLAGSTDSQAQFAVDLYCRDIAKTIAGYVTVLGGLDLLVFTGGIGEHSESVRKKICDALGMFHGFAVKVVAADEDAQIARHVAQMMQAGT